MRDSREFRLVKPRAGFVEFPFGRDARRDFGVEPETWIESGFEQDEHRAAVATAKGRWKIPGLKRVEQDDGFGPLASPRCPGVANPAAVASGSQIDFVCDEV